MYGVPGPASTPRIVAVVVTFNRRPLVERLIERLRHIAGLSEIVVVDNASTDGTAEWVSTTSTAEETSSTSAVPVRLVALETNTGGAGGFNAGMQAALEHDADLVWLMDDDGVPEPDCLAILLPLIERGYEFVGPVVVTEGQEDELVFPIRIPGTARVLHRTDDVGDAATDGLLDKVVIPFNGVLLTRGLIERIGLVDAKYFIWGDDVEYLWRAERDGARIATAVDARFVHPSVGDLGTPMAFGQTYNHSPSELKAYCMGRNNVVNLRTYRGNLHALAFVAKTIWFYVVTRRDLRRLRLSLVAMTDGWRGRWGRHVRYL
ncbi:putative glycosyl transferase, group 2 family [metagenome]|uniref:Putative glycosyl transferase, group 2 family n=1 Tax=metagenome TaxID=256318 RepID=A0A2P2CEK1_9ZZZZ